MNQFLPAVRRARRKHYAIPAFNVSNLEMTQAVVRAAVSLKSPVIVQTSAGALDYAGAKVLTALIRGVIGQLTPAGYPVFLHLDHGKHLSLVKTCVRLGYDSVHMDASSQSLAANIKLTRQAVDFARKYRIPVQGELGALLGREGLLKIKRGFDYRQMMTDPRLARQFVAATGISTLAVNIGTIHGSFKGIERIDLERLRQIARSVKLPLVMHGGSGNRPASIRQAIRSGISIINIDTDLRLAWARAMKKNFAKLDLTKKVDPREILTTGSRALEQEAVRVIKIFGSANQA